MNSKYLFLLLLVASVAGAWFMYYGDVSFSTSEAAGYAVKHFHVSGRQILTVDETVLIRWPRDWGSNDISHVYLAWGAGTGAPQQALLATTTDNDHVWRVTYAKGTVRGESMQFMIQRGGHTYLSAPFKIAGWLDGTDMGEASAQILSLQEQLVKVEEERRQMQSTIDGLLIQIQQLQAQIQLLQSQL